MTQEALRMALEALEANYLLVNGTETHGGLEQCLDGYYSGCFNTDPINKQTEEAIIAIKEALAQEQEPVAWEQFYPDIGKPQLTYPPQGIYYTPPQRTWVGLTDDEIDDLWESTASYYNTHDFARAIEAKLKEKNFV